ncbi:MAG: branched-chain amino acid aminotransferase [Ruminococcus flavefaciens]|nr:branched-chain amino acid aminotransferase [Ruminococcus flavefaciens]
METIDWNNIGFDYLKTDFNARYYYKDGQWSEMEITSDEYIKMHMSTTCLHYGLEAFEGLKAFRGVDGKVRIFRMDENAKRLQSSARKLCLPVPTVEMFTAACYEVVKRNMRFVPPYESGASLYLRPVIIGTKVGLGVKASNEAMLIVFCSPVGPYFKGGMKPIKVVIDREQDRAAPRGTGDIKAGGNYASSILSGEKAHDLGYSNVMYLDAAEHKYIEECGAANFFGIRDGMYVTPKSPSILPSITNKSLRKLAEDMGLKVEERHIPVDELDLFDEAGACGTAAVISPIESIYDLDTGKMVTYGKEVGKYSLALYTQLQDIQYGRREDKYGWCTIVEEE